MLCFAEFSGYGSDILSEMGVRGQIPCPSLVFSMAWIRYPAELCEMYDECLCVLAKIITCLHDHFHMRKFSKKSACICYIFVMLSCMFRIWSRVAET